MELCYTNRVDTAVGIHENSQLEERDAAAVIIQAMIRGMTHHSLRRRKYQAAQEIQRHIRGKLQRLRFPRH